MRKYAVAVLVTVEADDPDYAIEVVADMLKGSAYDWSFTEAVALADGTGGRTGDRQPGEIVPENRLIRGRTVPDGKETE